MIPVTGRTVGTTRLETNDIEAKSTPAYLESRRMPVVREPNPCREGDHGKFEVTYRDGYARLGKFHTSTHIVSTPTLLPVVNPNLQTISPREIWEMGYDALITNSYIIHESEEWNARGRSEGVHSMLDFPGMIMTDSGTFQQYVYGDEIQVGPEEIVTFQREIGVDVATMLDVFGRPDMSYEELSSAVEVTAERGPKSLEVAAETLLNGPIQGGTHDDLRKKSAELMSAQPFAVHPIGGIVPLMERHRYRELVEILVAVKSSIHAGRPIHMFGCGHPILFPITIALGADLFDSAAYVLFARDGRLLTPTGTVKLEGLVEWPHSSSTLLGISPADVRDMDDDARTEILSRHNLEVTINEIARCREAVRDGTIWNLVEERSHADPHLREATEWVYDNMPDDLVNNVRCVRAGGLRYSCDLSRTPRAKSARRRLSWTPPPTNHHGDVMSESDWVPILFYGVEGPWRERVGSLVLKVVRRWPNTLPFVFTPLGVIPYQLEDLNPFAHVHGPESIWDVTVESSHRALPCEGLAVPIIIDSNLGHDEVLESLECQLGSMVEGSERANPVGHFRRWAIRDKLRFMTGVDSSLFDEEVNRFEFIISRTKRVSNVKLDGVHLFSPRLTDGGLSLTMDGASHLHILEGVNLASVTVDSDAEPFVRQGRNVMHGFITDTSGNLSVGSPCLVLNESGELLGHGISTSDHAGMMSLRKGIAVRVRDGVGP